MSDTVGWLSGVYKRVGYQDSGFSLYRNMDKVTIQHLFLDHSGDTFPMWKITVKTFEDSASLTLAEAKMESRQGVEVSRQKSLVSDLF